MLTALMVNATAVLAPILAWSVRRIWVAVDEKTPPTFAVIPVVLVTAPAVIAEK